MTEVIPMVQFSESLLFVWILNGSEAISGHVGKDNTLDMVVQQDRGSCNLDTVELPDSFQTGRYVRNSYFGFGL